MSTNILPTIFHMMRADFLERAPDVLGLSYPLASLQQLGRQVAPAFSGHFNFGGAEFREHFQVVQWMGIDRLGTFDAGRLMWLTVALGFAAAASIPFDHFDPSRGRTSGP